MVTICVPTALSTGSWHDRVAVRYGQRGGEASERRQTPPSAHCDPNVYSDRKKFTNACWSAVDSIWKWEITVLASEPLLA